MADVAVVGGGMGGLSAASRLSAAGHRVRLLEAHGRVGGKLGCERVGDLTFDTGPSLLTMPDVVDQALRNAGTKLADAIKLRPLSPSFRYVYPDGVVVDTHRDRAQTLASVERVLGHRPRRELEKFLDYAARIWASAAPHFVFTEAPSVRSMGKWGWAGILALPQIDALRSMLQAIDKRVKSPHLRALLMRFATYNGSDVRSAPATLNCIAHVDFALGGYGVEGGMFELAKAFAGQLDASGAEVQLNCPVKRIAPDGGRYRVYTDQAQYEADAVIVNADVSHLRDVLMPAVDSELSKPKQRSTSGINAVFRDAHLAERAPHTVIFPQDYEAEFEALFDARTVPAQPTVYACAQGVAHGRKAPDGSEPVFLMVNAPAGYREGDVSSVVDRAREVALAAGVLTGSAEKVWSRGVQDLAALYPGSEGALYGAASNDKFAAFRRPSNRVDAYPGLYLASGSAHPGGGVPMCITSGQLAATALLEDLSA